MTRATRRARRIELLRRLHIWVGLFAFTSLLVFAAAGLQITFGDRAESPPAAVREIPFEPPPDLTDKQLADHVHGLLDLPFTRRIAEWALRRDREHRLRLDFYTPNGIHRVTVLEEARLLRVEDRRNTLGAYLDLMHAHTFLGSAPDLRLRAWAVYVDLSIFALLFLAVSGCWLWLETRPRLRWAQGVAVFGASLLAGLWWVLR